MANNDKTLAYVLLGAAVLAGGYAAYTSMQGNQSTGYNNVPKGSTINTQWGSWQNTTGQPVWVSATGMIITAAGQVLGNIAQILQATNGGNQSGQAAPDNSGTPLQTGIGNIWNSGYYYNPLPGGLM